jgi:hypothetical protein
METSHVMNVRRECPLDIPPSARRPLITLVKGEAAPLSPVQSPMRLGGRPAPNSPLTTGLAPGTRVRAFRRPDTHEQPSAVCMPTGSLLPLLYHPDQRTKLDSIIHASR